MAGQSKEIQRRCKQATRETEIKLGMCQERRKRFEESQGAMQGNWEEGREGLGILCYEVIGNLRAAVSGKGERQTTDCRRGFFYFSPPFRAQCLSLINQL